MGSEKNPFGGVQPPLLQSASSHFSRLSGLLPESGEEEGPSRAVKEMEMKGAIEVVRTPSPGFYSRLFLSAESPGDMDVYNRPLGSEHPHPVSVLLSGDQWVTSQGLNSPLLRAVPPVLSRGRGLAIPSSSFWVKHSHHQCL